MPKYCCVPGCTNKRGHLFPTSKAMLMRWRVAINRGTPNRKCLWQPNLNHDVVCHDHFLDSDYIVGRKRRTLKPNAVPSIFGYGKKRKPRRTQRSLSERQESWIGSEAVVMEDCSDKCQVQTTDQTDAGVQCALGMPQAPFSIEKYMADPKAVQYFTGFDDYHHFTVLYEILKPNTCTLKYQSSVLPIKDQLFLTIIKLRLFIDHQLIAYFFGISESTVSKIFSAWIEYIYSQFKELDIWPSKKVIVDTMPDDFKKLYPSTRVIIDSTEIPIERPSCINAQKQTFSSYKNKNTIKLLIGITPRGAVSFISDCYGGSASDRQSIEGSALYKNAEALFEKGDSIMADKGFLVQDLFASFSISINTPTFLRGKTKLQETDRLEDFTISSKRVHVERVIGYAKTYKILQGVIPYNLLPLSNKIVYVCFMLVNFRKNIVD